MEEEKVSGLTAILAKEKGFDEKCEYYLDENDKVKGIVNYQNVWWSINSKISWNCSLINIFKKDKLKNMTCIPRQSALQAWLRVKHNIHVNPFEEFGNYILLIHHYDSDGNKNEIWKHKGPYSNYEEALDLGLFEALKLIPIEH